MKQIRYSVFETNSSSVHSIAICTNNEFCAWHNGELYLNNGWWSGSHSQYARKKFLTKDEAMELAKSSSYYVPLTDDQDISDYFKEYDIYNYENWGDWYEHDVTHYTTPNGEEIVAVCYYGHD